jgi:hypothetical protein
MIRINSLRHRPLLILSAAFLAYFGLIATILFTYQHLRTRQQLNRAWHQTASNLTADSDFLSTPSDPKSIAYLFDTQGTLHWQSGTSSTVFETVNFSKLTASGPSFTVHLNPHHRFLILPKLIFSEGEPLAAIVVSKKITDLSQADDLEPQLRLTLEGISNQITIQQGQVSLLPNHYYPHIDGFIVVDKFGTILHSAGFVPYTVDLSHLQPYFQPSVGTLSSKGTKYTYQSASLIIDNTSYLLALLRPCPSAYQLLTPIFQVAAIASLFQVIVILLLFPRLLISRLSSPPHLRFNPDSGLLSSNTASLTIPPDTNQYYLIKALLSKPKKLWYTDELADSIFGMVDNPKQYQRPIYDAARLLNDKAKSTFGIELVSIQSGRYRLNPNIHLDSQ